MNACMSASMCMDEMTISAITGNATRTCQDDVTWAAPDVTNCQSRVFVDIMERVSHE